MGPKNGAVSSAAGSLDRKKPFRGHQTQTVNTLPIKIGDSVRGRKSHRPSHQIVTSITKTKDKY